ncbi:hypothetical protein PMI22_05752 [Pseudomonas sp. GM21]|uniref:hypothetical protein n=1 Tax=Pseudomonas sp. GM21 TaxID=1144325 RepID=UPI00027229C3|nr:hypothetical protein PMI22_05752 [Pseudomonas sp. GM21]
MSNPVMMFLDKLAATFGPLDFVPVADGKPHRFHVPGDRSRTLNGWYVLHMDGIPCGLFGSWKDGGNWHKWSSRQPADRLEAQLISQRIEQAKHRAEAERHQRQQDAAENAKRLWCGARRADPAHPYLVAKGIRTHGLRQHGDVLLVPLTYDGLLVNIQRIKPDGVKRFLFGGMVKGCCSPLGIITSCKPLYLCEGMATGATIHEETGAAVACAMNAGKPGHSRHPNRRRLAGIP